MKRYRSVFTSVLLVLCVLPSMPVFAQNTGADLEPVKIEVPDAVFGGTAVEYISDNLEPENFKDYPPFLAPKGVESIAKGKQVTSSDKMPSLGEFKMVVDGDKNFARNSLLELGEGPQWVQIDLEKESEIYAIMVWHYYEIKRVYFDFIVQVANDPEFKTGVITVYSNDVDNSTKLGVGKDKEYIDTHKGRLVDCKGVKGRFVRLYSNGNTSDEKNHYVEVEVFGRAAK